MEKLSHMELRGLYVSSNIIRVIKSRTMTCSGNVVRVGENRSAYKDLVEKPNRKRLLSDLGVDERIILKMELKEME
jgi:hypothetical protein